ncbi:YtxH domain-containing protein [Neisseria animaloris]|uniref:Tetratricopeptide repeat protein n=1 Tax=Neisseria animaloris TaxID=326522 RepID=A0A448U8R1_9NEIS|nr:YtxH domain-containing protein [Neisseria animaloris]VEJ20345.1 Uncharacterised protein [Neisseria animaloris]
MNNRFFQSFLSALILSLPLALSAATDTLAEPKQTTASNSPITKTAETATDEQPKINNLTASQAEMLQDNISALRMQVMDNEQQNLNWWMTFITIVFSVAGIVIAAIGVAIPLLLYKKEKRQLEQDLEQAKEYVEKIKEHYDSAEKYTQDIAEMKQWNPKEQNPEAQTNSFEKAKQLSRNEEIPLIEQLRAQAIVRSNEANKNKNYQDHLQAFYAWQAVLQQNSQDEQANFNSGLQACYLHEKGDREQQIHWFPEIEKYYQKTLIINPYEHDAINNWGNALNNEAQALAAQGNIEAAFKTWHRAEEKYQLSLALKPDDYGVAYNWGNTLNHEAQVLATQGDTETAFKTWRRAEEKYRLSLAIKPDNNGAAYNWGNALDNEAQALAAQGDTEAAFKTWLKAGEKYQLSLVIKPDDYEAAYSWGIALNNEARMLAKQGETAAALEKWRDAGEKYRQALAIKPDMYQAADNWLGTLLREHHTLKEKDNQPTEVQTKLQQARDLVNDFLSKNPQHQEKLAYNHACIYALEGNVAEAVKQLRLAQQVNNFPDKDHIETDPDFDNIRHTPEFQAWFKEAFLNLLPKANHG